MDMIHRPRRLRTSPRLRAMVRETRLSADSLILPLFIREGTGVWEEIPSLPGQIRYSPDTVAQGVAQAMEGGVGSFLLFGLPAQKDELGSGAWSDGGVVQQSVRNIKKSCPQAIVVGDVCLCEYTSHGHCGVLAGETVDNDATLPLLVKTALSQAQAGMDIIAPSDMMDGRVRAIREALDGAGFQQVAVMSYAAKYASAFYGPFREAADSAPGCGDRKGYQMDPHNSREALFEASLDYAEGADILMVKPALAYLDVVRELSGHSLRPVAAYSVSGEYAMIKTASAAGLLDEYAAMCESAVGIYRAGADLLITYFARELAQAIRKGDVG